MCLVGFLVLSEFLTTSQAESHQQTKSVSDGDTFVFKSTDGGISWTTIIDFDTGISAHKSNVIVVDPLISSTVYVGTNNGLIKTTDGGGTWAEITVGLNDRDIRAIAVYPQNPSILYILAFIGYEWGNIYRSTDAGKHWEQVTPRSSSAFSLTFEPLNPLVLYASGRDPDVPTVHKTTDGGDSWSFVSLPGLGLTWIDQLALDPIVPTNLYASNNGGFNRGGISKSTDAGRTWKQANLAETRILSLTHDPHTSSMLYVTGSDGVLRSTDGGDHWIDLSNGLNRSDVQRLAIDPTSPTTLFAGTFERLFKSTDGGFSWASDNLTRNIVSLAIDPGNPATVYAGSVAQPPRISGVSVEGKRLIVEGEGFHDGAAIYVDFHKQIYIDFERQKTVNDEESPHTKLIAKKAGKWIARGQTVSLQVSDGDGFVSPQFLFTRSND
jgi:photosystem II stability/assembly factor-like uncharacterized protein